MPVGSDALRVAMSDYALAERLSYAGIPDATLALAYDMFATGLRARVVEAGTGRVVDDRVEASVTPRLLDRALAEHLVACGRVARPDTPDWAGELIDLLPDVRARLSAGSGAFAMGPARVAMFRVSYDDLDVAWRPHRAAVAALGRSVAAAAPVSAVLVGPGCDPWPGLFDDALAELASPGVRIAYGRTNGSGGAHAIEQDSARTPDASRPPGAPTRGTEDLLMTPGGPRYYMPPTSEVPRPGPINRRLDRRLVIGAGAVGVSAAIGAVIVATPWIGGSSESAPAQAAATSKASASPPASETTASARPPLDLRAARGPIVAYTAPAQAPAQRYVATPSPAPRRRPAPPPPPPRHRTIPNPIPGLPPIVLP